jgi:peptidyl-prolyl cis-trans isomerase C
VSLDLTEGNLKAKTLMLAAVLPAALMLSGCDQVKKLIGGKPKGQVVATVNGEEITTTELGTELGNFTSKNPATMKAAQQQALQQIIMRDLIAQKAKEAKLDKSPEYALQVRRGEETLLAQLYQRKLAASAAVPARQDAEAYVSSHPQMFAARKILVLDQVIADPSKLKKEQIAPLKTLEDVKSLLSSQGVQYQENVAAVDTMNTDPRMIAQIDKLTPGEVFVVPQRGAVVFNRLSSTRPAPVTGDMAITVATNALRNQKAQELVRTQMISMRTEAEKSIVYNPAFKPAKPFTPPPAPGATPAATSATPAQPTPVKK